MAREVRLESEAAALGVNNCCGFCFPATLKLIFLSFSGSNNLFGHSSLNCRIPEYFFKIHHFIILHFYSFFF